MLKANLTSGAIMAGIRGIGSAINSIAAVSPQR
jgi:hypothetical protein